MPCSLGINIALLEGVECSVRSASSRALFCWKMQNVTLLTYYCTITKDHSEKSMWILGIAQTITRIICTAIKSHVSVGFVLGNTKQDVSAFAHHSIAIPAAICDGFVHYAAAAVVHPLLSDIAYSHATTTRAIKARPGRYVGHVMATHQSRFTMDQSSGKPISRPRRHDHPNEAILRPADSLASR